MNMNLRHCKPTYSYSEQAPALQLQQREKRDPKIRYHAQLLANFMGKINQKCEWFEAFKASTRKQKKKSQNKRNSSKKSLKRSKSKKKSEKLIKTKKQTLPKIILQQKMQIQQPVTAQEEFQPSIQFLQVLLDLYGSDDTSKEHSWVYNASKSSLKRGLNRLCETNPEYLPDLQQLYNQGYFVEGFNPNFYRKQRKANSSSFFD